MVNRPVKGLQGGRILWLATAAASLLLACTLFWPQAMYRFYLYHAQEALNARNLAEGTTILKKAERLERPWSYPNDRAWQATLAGDLLRQQANDAKTLASLAESLENAVAAYQQALLLAPRNLDAMTGFAQTVDSLDRLYPFLYKKTYSLNPLTIYKQLLDLMPVNLYSHALLTKYFDSRQMTAQLADLVARSITIYPPLYFQLKKQPFYTKAMDEQLTASLRKAISLNIFPEEACKALSDLAFQQEDYLQAVEWYREAQPRDSFQDHSDYYLHLGILELHASLSEEGLHSFLTALGERRSNQALERIYHAYKSQKYYKEFMEFAQYAEDRFELSQFVDILRAKCLIEMQQYGLATSRLITITSRQYEAEANYLQAKIAEAQQDWDMMELKSQRATVLDPGNYQYHMLFSRSLQHQKKYPQAERAATKAIEALEKANRKYSWLYNHRAWLRWAQENFEGALFDWREAVSISPDSNELYYNLALVYEKGGNFTSAIDAVEQAIKLKPEIEKYRQKLANLRKKVTL